MSDKSKAANKKRAQFWKYHINTWSKSEKQTTQVFIL